MFKKDIFGILKNVYVGFVMFLFFLWYKILFFLKFFEYMVVKVVVVVLDFEFWRRIVEEVDCGVLVDFIDI